MSLTPSYAMPQGAQLSLLDKTVTVASWLLGCGVFLTVGWMALRPDDPQGAVSVLTRGGPLKTLLQAAALSSVAAAVGTVLAGRRLSDAGTFAAAVGLAAVSLRGGTVATLLVSGAEGSGYGEHGLAIRFAAESLGWFGVVVMALLVSALAARWCFGDSEASPAADPLRLLASRRLAACDAPRLGPALFGVSPARQTAPRDGLVHTLITAGVGVMALGLLSKGLGTRSIQHGQVCFGVFVGVAVAATMAYRFVPVRSPLWSILAVPLIALTGYLWAALRPAEPGLPPNMPSSHFLRVLPIQYVGVGTVAALTAFWYVAKEAYGGAVDPAHKKRPAPKRAG